MMSHENISDVSPIDSKVTLKSIRRKIEDFTIIKNGHLGEGSYGKVSLVEEKATGILYAMKAIPKELLLKYSSTENVKREIKIQSRIRHRHCIKLYYYFEDKRKIYMIMEYAENGSLYGYLQKKNRHKTELTEKEAFVYFFQTALGIDYLHKNQVIHRDLKPENLLLDKRGNVKLCDFGWSAFNNLQDCRTTLCGTIDYMAPEMLLGKPYDHRIDIWALGILLYELLHGKAPYPEKLSTPEKMDYIKLSHPIEYKSSLSVSVIDVIKRLLIRDPATRMTLEELFTHPWMKKYESAHQIDLDSLISQNSGWQSISENGPVSFFTQFSEEGTDLKPSLSVKSTINKTENSRPEKRRYLDRGGFNSNTKNSRRNEATQNVSAPEPNSGFFFGLFQKLGCVKRDEI